MTETGWILVVMWAAWGAGVVAIARKSPSHAGMFGIFSALVLMFVMFLSFIIGK